MKIKLGFLKKMEGDPVKKEMYKNKMQHLDEHYDEHLNEKLPDYLHRGDILSGNRLLGYTDAMMATCATFLVIPLRNLNDMLPSQSLKEFIIESGLEVAMFFIGFLIVLSLWEAINIRSLIIKRVDDVIIWCSVLSMLAISVLPFSLALQGHYTNEKTSIIITCALLAFFEVMDIVIICYAMGSPRILHVEIQNWSKSDRSSLRNIVCIKPAVNLVLVMLGGAFCLLHYSVSWVFMSLLILMPLFRKLILFIRRRVTHESKIAKRRFFYYFTRGNISKERVEAMSDAAVAIIACILILDITVEEFPKKAAVKAHGLNYELAHMEYEFYAFLATFTLVSSLWFVNHTVLHLFRTINVVALYLQKIFLALTCLCPLGANMMSRFAKEKSQNTNIAIFSTSLAVFLSSSANLLMLLYGLCTKKKYLHAWAVFGCFQVNMREHVYTLIKTANIPFWSLICLLCTFGSPSVAQYGFLVCFAGIFVTFTISKLVFMNHVGKEVFSYDLSGEMNTRRRTIGGDLPTQLDGTNKHQKNSNVVMKNQNPLNLHE